MPEIEMTLNKKCPGCGATVLLYIIETEEKGTIHTKVFCVNLHCTFEEGNTVDIEKLLINEGFVLAENPQPVPYRLTRKGHEAVKQIRKETGS